MKAYLKEKTGLFRVIYAIILIGYILSHLPFLAADADISIASGSRGAWTDEGLNTCQIRNFVNHGHFDLLDCDNLLKTPFFSLFLYPFFKLFGISMVGARLITVLFCVALLLLFFLRKTTLGIGLVFVITTMMLFPIHQYSHLCLAEMYSSMLIIASALVYSFYKAEHRFLPLLFSFLILFVAVLFKIQFGYVLFVPVLIAILNYLRARTIAARNQLIVASSILMNIVFLMALFWYMPFKEAWRQIAKQQSGVFSLHDITVDLIWQNLQLTFLAREYLIFTICFILSLFAAAQLIMKKQYPKEYRALLLISLLWFVVELHKLGMVYLPMRYLISLYVSMGFFMSVVIGYYISLATFADKSKAVLCLLLLFLCNAYFYKQAFFSRNYAVQKMNSYFQEVAGENDIVIGAWAPSCTWQTKSFSYPIWADFLGKRDIVKYYHPDFIVTEDDEKDSGFAYQKNGIDIASICDSLTQIKVALWNLNVYKVKK